MLEILEKHIDVLSQDYSVRPDQEKSKPVIYVSIKGLDFADHPGAIDPEKELEWTADELSLPSIPS